MKVSDMPNIYVLELYVFFKTIFYYILTEIKQNDIDSDCLTERDNIYCIVILQ